MKMKSKSNTRIKDRKGTIMNFGWLKILTEDLARFVEYLIKGAAWLLLVMFGWLKMKDMDFMPVVQNIPAQIVFQVALVLYYACWINGTLFDTRSQNLVYVKVDRLRALSGAIIATITLVAVFAFLCWADTYRKFCILLVVFFAFNIMFWVYLIKMIVPDALKVSEAYYRKMRSYIEMEQLKLVAGEYISGSWQWYRFALGSIIILLMNIMAFSNIATFLSARLGGISPELIQSASMLLFVAVIESWIWYMRMRLSIGLRLLKEMKASYQFVPADNA
jgi:hypothetical protein